MKSMSSGQVIFFATWIWLSFVCAVCDAAIHGCSTNVFEPILDQEPTEVRRYTRVQLFSFRRTKSSKSKQHIHILVSLNIFNYRGTRGGKHKHRRAPTRTYTGNNEVGQIPVMISAFRPFKVHSNRYQENQTPYTAARERNIIVCPTTNNQEFPSGIGNNQAPILPPSLYLINPTSLVKPHALQHLTSDAVTYGIDIIVVTETWMKAHHCDHAVDIPGYTIFRRDRKKRRGGGVAVYARREFNGRMLNFSEFYDDNIELIWISLTVHGRSLVLRRRGIPPA